MNYYLIKRKQLINNFSEGLWMLSWVSSDMWNSAALCWISLIPDATGEERRLLEYSSAPVGLHEEIHKGSSNQSLNI